MTRRALLAVALLLTTACLAPRAPRALRARTPRPPNVVVILTDDQGYADVGAFGATAIATPNLDRLAAEGARYTDFYVAQPVCSASRAALLTGCYPNRIGIQGALGPRARHGLAPEETTLAELLRARGYATAVFGKWHLGHRAPFLPANHGFDESLVTPYSNDMWPWHPLVAWLPEELVRRKRGFPPLVLYEGLAVADAEVTPRDQARFTELFTDRAVEFVRRHADEPFFLYLAHPMPHVPLFAGADFRGRSAGGVYGDVIEELDHSVGRVLLALDEAGVADETLVFFTSDNGPWLEFGDHAGSAVPLREGKGTVFDGGVRVPAIARWPGHIPPGSVERAPWMTIDLLPTIAHLVGAPVPALPIDGRDATDALLARAGGRSPQAAYFFWYHGGRLEAVRSGPWKLHLPHPYRSLEGGGSAGRGGSPGRYVYPETELALYDLARDPTERTPITDRPGVVARLLRLAAEKGLELGDTARDVRGASVRPAGRLPGAEAERE